MNLVIYTVATEGYHYALAAQARRVCACIAAVTNKHLTPTVLLVSNKEDIVSEAKAIYERALGKDAVRVLIGAYATGLENYKIDAQLLIAQMRTEATSAAIALDADFLWSLDSDVLPPYNALRSMFDMLEFDANYYSVAFCPYPSQGGGPFLSGRGTIHQPILPDFYENERTIPPEMLEQRKKLRDEAHALSMANEQVPQSLADSIAEIEKSIRDTPPTGNVFASNAQGWRKRGWFDCAYPAIGKGAVVPVDWTGMGCTLMTREAALLCDWTGYEGLGTEDLYINFHRWYANGIKICSLPHCVCDHVVRARDGSGKLVHIISYHETEGECVGHLRQRTAPWYDLKAGEKSDPTNDGKLYTPTTVKVAEPTPRLTKPRKPKKV